MQHEVTRKQKLLNDRGVIQEPGWARQLVWDYNREQMKASWIRKKEWDYYLVTNDKFGVALTIADLGYMGLISASFLDFERGIEHTETVLDPFPRGKKYGLRKDSGNGVVSVCLKKVTMQFEVVDGTRTLLCEFPNFDQGQALKVWFTLKQPDMDTMCIATPFKEKPTAFYYNQKINCMNAKGKVEYCGEIYRFQEENSFGILDWGRGIWTYDNVWYWGTGSGLLNGESFGFNLGYGFSDRSSASENIIFYKHKAHKLEDVLFDIPVDDTGKLQYLEEWKITSSDGRLEGVLNPILDRKAYINAKIIISDQHQIFGKFTGTAILEDGTSLEIKDFLCAIEVVHNKY